MKKEVKLFYSCFIVMNIMTACSMFKEYNKPADIMDFCNVEGEEWIDSTLIIPELYGIEKEVSKVPEKVNKVHEMASSTKPKKHYKKPVKISKHGKNLIKKYEKCRLTVYRIKGERRNTIGWGHQIRPEDKIGNKITQKKADELFDKDIKWVSEAVNRLINDLDPRYKFTQGFFDGMCSMVYNCGEQGVRNSEFYKRLERSRYDSKIKNINQKDLLYSIAAVKNDHIYMNGHKPRRYDEHLIMLG